MSGRLIVLEGIDGCGKSTQFRRLTHRLEREGIPYRRLQFPRYSEPSSMLLRMYLQGDFGSEPGDVNAYAASTFFAVDRFASWKQDWGAFYEQGGLVLTDRYTTSNAVHQASKLPRERREEFWQWLFHFEYTLLGLPRPDQVLLLDMPPEQAAALRQARAGAGDIHEDHSEYLRECRETALQAAEFDRWQVIPCVRNGALRTIEEIGSEIDLAIKQEG